MPRAYLASLANRLTWPLYRQEMAEADRHIEEEMEAERGRAEDMAEQRKARAAEYAKSYRFMFAMYNDILMCLTGA